tara:strand:- start:257 stop:364 length:108 start_codon:yes stop_codon:yes gene_type:complete
MFSKRTKYASTILKAQTKKSIVTKAEILKNFGIKL